MNQVRLQTIPGGRICHHMVSVGKFLIIYGGYYYNSSANNNDLMSYDTISGVWKQHRIPFPLENICRLPTICAFRNKVYISYEKYNEDSHPCIHFIFSFDVTNAKWEIIYSKIKHNNGNVICPIYGSLLIVHNESLYALGRNLNSMDGVDLMYKFSLNTLTWSIVPQSGLTDRFNGAIFTTLFKNQLYLFVTPSTIRTETREVWVFNFSTNEWTRREAKPKINQYPRSRPNESYAFTSNCAYMSGGDNFVTSTCYSDVWKLDLETLEWFKMQNSLQTGVYHHHMAIVDDCYLYSVGGCHYNSDYLETMECFILRPPSLYRLCLESICRSPNMTSYMKSLPTAIVDELNINDDYSPANIIN